MDPAWMTTRVGRKRKLERTINALPEPAELMADVPEELNASGSA